MCYSAIDPYSSCLKAVLNVKVVFVYLHAKKTFHTAHHV